jgi:hypothetical protein
MNIVHLTRDEKFLPLARSLFEEAFPGQNRYLVVAPKRGARRWLPPAPDIVQRSSLRFRTGWIAGDVATADCVVVHGMSTMFAQALRHVRPQCLVVWIGWGFDYMRLLSPHLGPLLLPGTARLVQGIGGAHGGAAKATWAARLRAWLRPLGAALAPPKPPALVSIAPRIDVFSANPADARLLLEVLPALQARLHVIASFTVEDVFAAGPPAMSGPDVLLGNSATPANNHVEALELLRDRLPVGGRLLVPLSYGRARYAQAVVEAGRRVLGERFDALTDWMPIEAYNTRIARCGFVVMNHRRQQAVGNICAALYKGASVYLRRENPLFGFFTGLGISLQAIESLESNPGAPLVALSPEQRRRNREAIEARFGRANVVAAIRALEGFRR